MSLVCEDRDHQTIYACAAMHICIYPSYAVRTLPVILMPLQLSLTALFF